MEEELQRRQPHSLRGLLLHRNSPEIPGAALAPPVRLPALRFGPVAPGAPVLPLLGNLSAARAGSHGSVFGTTV